MRGSVGWLGEVSSSLAVLVFEQGAAQSCQSNFASGGGQTSPLGVLRSCCKAGLLTDASQIKQQGLHARFDHSGVFL